jgi:protein tyrosine phosphatase (PTP) superfamily phosphohydrolase (DUF442 family)
MDDPIDIYNWRRLDDRITTSGQPTEDQLAALKSLGVTHIINLGLHTHPKALLDEAASVAGLGMDYIHLPVDFADPKQDDLTAFYAIMDRLKGRTIHVHCIANYRVSAFIYRLRVDVLGWDRKRAQQDLDAIWTPQGVWAQIVGGA